VVEGDIGDYDGADYVASGSADAAGVPTLVEVKRSSDTRARREVVAQLLEYAANATAY
jgi:hypothetical protein